MTTTEIIDVIKACKEAGVNKFEHAGLKLDFQGMALAGPADDATQKKLLAEREFRIKEEQLENLRLSDPLAYETLIQYDLQAQE